MKILFGVADLSLGVPFVSSRFGTAPQPWNYLFGAMKALPPALLGDKDKMQALSLFSEPIIRAVDLLVGATNAMRVDAFAPGNETPALTLRVAHEELPDVDQLGEGVALLHNDLLGPFDP